MTVLVADNAGHLELLYGFLYGCTRRYLSRCLLVYVKSGCLLRMRRMKRPAAAPAGRMMKRPACASSAPSAVSGASSAVQKIEGMLMLEETCGERYRREVSDLGLGFAVYDMKSKLQTWGYEASRESCQEWLKRYRLGDGAKDGGVAVYDVYREDLLRWYHVDRLGPAAMQDRLRAEHGVYAHRSNTLRNRRKLRNTRDKRWCTSARALSILR